MCIDLYSINADDSYFPNFNFGIRCDQFAKT